MGPQLLAPGLDNGVWKHLVRSLHHTRAWHQPVTERETLKSLVPHSLSATLQPSLTTAQTGFVSDPSFLTFFLLLNLTGVSLERSDPWILLPFDSFFS